MCFNRDEYWSRRTVMQSNNAYSKYANYLTQFFMKKFERKKMTSVKRFFLVR